MGEFWLDILRKQTEVKGRSTVAKELSVSTATLSLVLSDKYPASTAAIENKVANFYGSSNGQVDCPALGDISPDVCFANWEKAKKIGMSCGNPRTIRLYKACLNCSLRNG